MCEHSGYRMFTHCKHTMFAQHHLDYFVPLWRSSCLVLVRSQIFEFVELHLSLTHRLTWLYIIFHQLGKTEGFLAFLFNKLSPHYGHNIENVELYLSWNICGFENHHLIRSLFVQTDVTWCLQIYRQLLDCFCNTILLLGAFWTRHLQPYIAQSN